MIKTSKYALALTVATVVIGGCGGGGQSAEQQVRTTVNEFTVDVGQGHWSLVCPLTTGQQASQCRQLLASGPAPTAAQCEGAGNSVVGQACAAYQGAQSGFAKFTSLTISKIVVQGSSATVTFNGSSEVMTLTDQGGKWLISSA